MAWRSIDWAPNGWTGPVTQGQSGEDWWYNHTNSYDASGNLNGYLAVGYHTKAVASQASLNAHNNFFTQGCEEGGIGNFGSEWQAGESEWEWEAFETSTRRKAHQFGNIAFFNLDGKMQWCFPFNTLDFQDAVQIEPGGDFICLGSHSKTLKLDNSGTLGYNPTAAGASHFSGCIEGEQFRQKMYACRVSAQGVLQWEYMYTMPETELEAYTHVSVGYGIIANSPNTFLMAGNYNDLVEIDAFVVSINENGEVLNKNTFDSQYTNFPSSGAQYSIASSVSSDKQGHNLLMGTEMRGGATENVGFVLCIDDALNPHPDWATNPIYFAPGNNQNNSKCWNGSYHVANEEFLVPVITDCSTCNFAGENAGDLYLNRLNASTGTLTGSTQLFDATAFDLRADACETSDGGIAVISSAKTPGFTSQTVYTNEQAADFADGTYNIFPPNPTNPAATIGTDWKYWDTDARIAKLDGNGNILWQKQFDAISYPLPTRQPFPGNVKRQECMYSISEAEDGGLVVAGNTGGNFDDFYLAKVKSDCPANSYLAAVADVNAGISNDIVEDYWIFNTIETWNTDKTVYDKVTVESGSTLIIDGATIQFAGVGDMAGFESYAIDPPFEAMIVVEKGAFLHIRNGATLTNLNDCGSNKLWKGLEVHGNPDVYQSYADQGRIRIEGVSTIANAHLAIRADNSQDQFAHTGGIVQAFDARFENNTADVLFMPFRNYRATAPTIERNNRSFFTNCQFVTDHAFRGLDNGRAAILFGVNGIPFKGCTFDDTRPEATDQQWRKDHGRTGIYSLWSAFAVNELCSGPQSFPPPPTCEGQESVFENMQYGIRALGELNPARFAITVENSTFNCHNGIYLSDQSSLKVVGNDLTVNGRTGTDLDDWPYGIYLDNSHNYTVENNELFGDNPTYPSAYAAGIVAYNQHDGNTDIYKNSLDGIFVGLEALGQNKSLPNDPLAKGLQFQCNDINNGPVDMVVLEAPGATSPVVGIATNQGTPGSTATLAGNRFGNGNPQSFLNLYNAGEHFNYHHHDPATEPRVRPDNVFGSVTLVQGTPPYSEGNACPDHQTGGPGNLEFLVGISEKEQKQLEADAKDAELKLLVDGGNTEVLKLDVILATDQNAYNKYSELMDNAGYVSETVLKEVSAKEQGLNEAMVRDVLVANPQAAKSTEITEVLNNRIDPLPNYMRAQIEGGKELLSFKENKEALLAKDIYDRDKAIDNTISTLLKDSTDRLDEMALLLKETEEVAHVYRLAALYDGAGKTQDATNVLNDLLARTDLTPKQIAEATDLLEVRDLQLQWQQQGKQLNALTAGDLAQLYAFEYLTGKAAAKARQLLAFNGALTYGEPVSMPPPLPQARLAYDDEPTAGHVFAAYPNPATDYITLEFDLIQTKALKPVVVVNNLEGKRITSFSLTKLTNQQIFTINGLATGKYYFNLMDDAKILATQEITIVK